MDRNKFFSGAAAWGLVFAAICIGYDLLMAGITWINDPESWRYTVLNILSFVIWAAKLTGLFILLRYVMEKYYDSVGAPQYGSNLFGYGVLISALSGLVYAAAGLVYNLYISPESGAEAIDAMRAAYAEMGMLNPMLEQSLAQIENSYPTMMFFGQLIYFTLYGLIVSAIISGVVRRKKMFTENA